LWSDIADLRRTIAQLSGSGTTGHIGQIVDPAEETVPYWGRIEFIEPEDRRRITAGRAENWRADYGEQVAQHRAAIRSETDRLGWSFSIHRTDRPASELFAAFDPRLWRRAAYVRMAAQGPTPSGRSGIETRLCT